jgi:ligand-binding sensor domain-containing protein/two-component sensor histidine kinase
MSKAAILFILALLFTVNIYSQKYNFRNFSVNDGLTQSEIYSICEDKRGNLWFGSLGGGIIRFDGYTFTSYREEDGLVNNFVRTIYEDSKGNLWIGTEEGACVYNGKTFESFDKANGPGNNTIKAILEDKAGNLWFGTENNGLFKYRNKRFEHFTLHSGLPDNTINCIFLANDRSLWIGTNKGASQYKNGRFNNFTKEDGLMATNIRGICTDRAGRIWLASGGSGVSSYDGVSFTNYTAESGLCSNMVYSARTDHKGRIWFGTANGVSMFDGTSFRNYYDSNGLASNVILCISEDSSHDLWFGTSGGGVSRFDNNRFVHFTENDKMGRQVYSIIQAINGKMLFASSLGGLTLFDGLNYSMLKGTNDFTSSKVKALYYDRDSNLWIGTLADGVYKFSSEGFQHTTEADSLISNSINGIAMDTAKNIWFSSPDSGICVLKKDNTFEYFNTQKGLLSNTIYALVSDEKGRVWIGTDKGLNSISIFGTKTLYPEISKITQEDGLSGLSVRCIALDKSGNVFAGTAGGGVSILIGERVIAINKTNGLTSNNIYTLVFDNNNNLWVGTEQGLDRIVFGKNYSVKECRHFGKNEGFYGIEVYRNACFKDNNGRLWFGTVNGATVYDPKEDLPYKTEPQTHLTGIKLFFENIENTKFVDSISSWYPIPKALVLPYNQNSLTFHFVGIYQRNPESVRYKWKLEGWNNNWSPPLAKHEVTYSNLPPGNYTFMVISGNEYNVWNKEPVRFTFKILPPFWKRWWFQLASGLFVIGTIAYIFQARIRKIKEKNRIEKEKLEMEKNIMELEQEAARLQMNPHFIFNSLNSIQGFISANDAFQAKRYLAKFARLMRLILENAREKFIPLQNEIEMLENYLELERLSKNNKFEFKISVREDIEPEMIEIPPMMIQPFVENAIIHGIKNKEGQGKIDISFSLHNSILACEVIDDGVGRAKAMEIKARTNANHKSTGMLVTKKRLEQLETIAGIHAGFEIIDLKDEKNSPSGTKVIISIPVEN